MSTTTNFDQLIQSLESGVESIAKSSLQDYLTEAKSDGENAINNMKASLQQWSVEVENGSLTYEDLAFLLKGEEALDEMTALKQAGLSEIRIDEFKDSIINLFIGTITSFVKV